MAGLGKFLKQAQKMQEQMQRVQDELAQREVEGTAGGGAVKAVAKCDGTIVSVKIDPKVVDPKDVEMLEDLVVGAVANALEIAKKTQSEEMGKITQGINIPGLSM
jgi:DNA-binding YbaB/EbfC family protein